MADIKIELAHTRIIRFSADVTVEKNTAIQIQASYSAEVYEPQDPLDSTAMVRATCSMKDTTGKLLTVDCTAELYFNFDPIPEDRAEAIREISRNIIQTELNQRIQNLLREMGHNFSVN